MLIIFRKNTSVYNITKELGVGDNLHPLMGLHWVLVTILAPIDGVAQRADNHIYRVLRGCKDTVPWY